MKGQAPSVPLKRFMVHVPDADFDAWVAAGSPWGHVFMVYLPPGKRVSDWDAYMNRFKGYVPVDVRNQSGTRIVPTILIAWGHYVPGPNCSMAYDLVLSTVNELWMQGWIGVLESKEAFRWPDGYRTRPNPKAPKVDD